MATQRKTTLIDRIFHPFHSSRTIEAPIVSPPVVYRATEPIPVYNGDATAVFINAISLMIRNRWGHVCAHIESSPGVYDWFEIRAIKRCETDKQRMLVWYDDFLGVRRIGLLKCTDSLQIFRGV